MKRTLVAVVLAAACLAVGGTLWRRVQERPVCVAQLAPAETLLLAEFPDLPATATRWKETALCAIYREPQVQAFLAQPLAALQKNETWAGTLRSLTQIQPTQAFLAVANVTNNMPRAVVGLAFAGRRGEVERLLAQAREQARSASPNGKLERLSYGIFSIETFSDNGITVAGCFAQNWYFVANDVDLLKATLDRLSGKTVTALDSAPAYRQSLEVLPPRSDFRLFTQPGVISDRLLTRLNAVGRGFDPQDTAALRKIRAIALSTRLEGQRMRGSLFLYQPETAQRPVLNGQTLGLTTPNTLFYAAMAPLISDEIPQRGEPRVFPGLIPMKTLLATLNSPPATLGQFKTSFGPEHAFLLDWPAGETQPNVFLVSEIRDSAEARRFMESVFHAWARADAEGVSFWTLTMDDPALAQFHPTVALTARHLLVGLSPESLKPFATNAAHPSSGTGATLEQSPAFQGAMATVSKPQMAIAYLDAKPLFERVYDLLRPLAMLWGSDVECLSGVVDFSKLPLASAIAGHLTPIGLSVVQKNAGILLESTGPVSFLELGEGIGMGALFLALPGLQEKQPLLRNGNLPSVPATRLSAPQTFTTPGIPTGSQSVVVP